MISEASVDHSIRVVVLDFSGCFAVWPAVQLQWAANPVRMHLLAADSKWMVVHQPVLILGWRQVDCMRADYRVYHMLTAVHRMFVAAVYRTFAALVHTCWSIGHRKSWIERMDPIHIYYVTLVQLSLRKFIRSLIC